MIQISELCHFLEEIAPLQLQEDYDNAGLITGDPNWPINSILISLDATEEVIDEAIQLEANMIISHHPIIFRGLKKLTGSHYVERSIIKAVKNDIALYAIHTNLDNVFHNGVNQKIAEKLGLVNCSILKPKSSASDQIGAGLTGYLKNPMKSIDFLEYVKQSLNCNSIKYTRIKSELISKVALCGGAGSFLIKDAIDSKSDVYITSDIKYHEFFEANDQILLMDIGHYESEQFTIQLLFELISKKYRNFASHCTKKYTNPVQYL